MGVRWCLGWWAVVWSFFSLSSWSSLRCFQLVVMWLKKFIFPHKKWLEDSLRLHRWSLEGGISGSGGGGGSCPRIPYISEFFFQISAHAWTCDRKNHLFLIEKSTFTMNMGCSTARSTINDKSWCMCHRNLYVLFSVCVGVDFLDFTWESITYDRSFEICICLWHNLVVLGWVTLCC